MAYRVKRWLMRCLAGLNRLSELHPAVLTHTGHRKALRQPTHHRPSQEQPACNRLKPNQFRLGNPTIHRHFWNAQPRSSLSTAFRMLHPAFRVWPFDLCHMH